MPPKLLEISGTVTSGSPPIQHDGAVLIKGNVEPDCLVVANQNIEILGDVVSSQIKSLYGSVIVRGGIKGSSASVSAGENIETQYIQNATVKAYGNIIIHDNIIDAKIMAKNSIHMEKGTGKIEGGETEAGIEIIANLIGNPKKTTTFVKLTNFRQADLYSFLINYEKESAALSKQIEELEKIIQVIKILGSRVVDLPLEKKQELAMKVKLYNEMIEKRKKLDENKNLMVTSDREIEIDRFIIAKQSIFGGVTVSIDRTESLIQKEYNNVILYKKGIIIIGNFEEFMNRKKFS
jgi:hypothetical protein